MTITEQLAEALERVLDQAESEFSTYSYEFHKASTAARAALAAYEASKAEDSKLLDKLKSLHWHIVENPVNKEVLVHLIEGAIKEASKAAPSPTLWCCHVRGPDDVHPAPDYETALKWSDMINDWSAEANAKFKDEEKVMSKAAPALWPWSPESHARTLAKAIAGFSPRIPNEHEPAG